MRIIVCCLFLKSHGILDSNNTIVTYDRYTECGLDVRTNATYIIVVFYFIFIFAMYYFPASQGYYARPFK